jgi:hypothetical protein
MLYLLKALRVSVKEPFVSEANGQLNPGPLGDINDLLSSFGTPDLTKNEKTPYITKTPDISKLGLPNIIAPEPVASLSITAAVPAATAIPAPVDHTKLEAPIIPKIPITEGMAQTASDQQGLAAKDIASAATKEAFETKKEFTEAMSNGKSSQKKRRSHRSKRIVKKCPPMPDMTLYIRKDQIPCWGCVLK